MSQCDTIRTLQSIQSETSHLPTPGNSLWTLTNFTDSFGRPCLRQKQYQQYAITKWLPAPEFPLRSQVFVKAEHFRTTWALQKTIWKELGLFKIIARPRTHSYTLRLPDTMKVVHLVFHVSQLEPFIPNTIPNRIQPPPPPVVIDSKPKFEISEILDSKINKRCRACKLLYLVWWEGYKGTDEETSWILASELRHTLDLVVDFHSSYPNKPRPNYWSPLSFPYPPFTIQLFGIHYRHSPPIGC